MPFLHSSLFPSIFSCNSLNIGIYSFVVATLGMVCRYRGSRRNSDRYMSRLVCIRLYQSCLQCQYHIRFFPLNGYFRVSFDWIISSQLSASDCGDIMISLFQPVWVSLVFMFLICYPCILFLLSVSYIYWRYSIIWWSLFSMVSFPLTIEFNIKIFFWVFIGIKFRSGLSFLNLE